MTAFADLATLAPECAAAVPAGVSGLDG